MTPLLLSFVSRDLKMQGENRAAPSAFQTARLGVPHTQYIRRHAVGCVPRCKICGKAFTRFATMRTHVESVHYKKKFICQLCHRPFSYLRNLYMHQKENCHGTRSEMEKTTRGGVVRHSKMGTVSQSSEAVGTLPSASTSRTSPGPSGTESVP